MICPKCKKEVAQAFDARIKKLKAFAEYEEGKGYKVLSATDYLVIKELRSLKRELLGANGK